MPLLVILIAPNPSRWMGSFPPIRNLPAFVAGLTPPLCSLLTSTDFFFAPINSPRRRFMLETRLNSDSDAGRVQSDSVQEGTFASDLTGQHQEGPMATTK